MKYEIIDIISFLLKVFKSILLFFLKFKEKLFTCFHDVLFN